MIQKEIYTNCLAITVAKNQPNPHQKENLGYQKLSGQRVP
jgi:hypothetical protein